MFPSSKITKQEFELLKEMLKASGSLEAKIESASMAPVISTGQALRIEKINDLSALRRFDIVVLWTNGILTCHYLLHRNKSFAEGGEDIFVSRGLANNGEDLPTPASCVLGKVEIQIPWYLRLRETWMAGRRRR